MKRAPAALFLLASIPALTETPKTATVTTKYGAFRFFAMEIIRAEKDRPCGFMAKVENHTGTTWDNPVFSVKVSGFAPGGGRQAFEIKASSDYIGNILDVDQVTGKCITDRPEISVDKIDISLTEGKPDLAIVQRLENARAAQNKARKRESDAAAARAASLAHLSLVSSGAPTAFIGSDRKCAEQFQQALAMEGLEKRKRLADLVAYGCGFMADSPVHAEILQKEGNFALVKIADGKHDGKSGWVPAAWVK